MSALLLTLRQCSRWHVSQILYWLKMQTYANAGVDAYVTPWRRRIKGATKAKSECIRFSLTLTRTHKRNPNLTCISYINVFLIFLLYIKTFIKQLSLSLNKLHSGAHPARINEPISTMSTRNYVHTPMVGIFLILVPSD